MRHRLSHARPRWRKAACRCRCRSLSMRATIARQCRCESPEANACRFASDLPLARPAAGRCHGVVGRAPARRRSASTGTALVAEPAAGHRRTWPARPTSSRSGSPPNAEDDARLVEIRLKLEELSREPAVKSGVAFRPRLAEINARIEQLGPPPADGPAARARHRHRRAAGAGRRKGRDQRRARRRRDPVDPRQQPDRPDRRDAQRPVPQRADQALRADPTPSAANCWPTSRPKTTSFYRAVSSWLRFVVQFKLQSVLAATFFALVAAAVLLIGGRRAVRRLFDADPRPRIRPISAGCRWPSGRRCCRPRRSACSSASTLFFFDYFNVLRGDIGVYAELAVRASSASSSASTGWRSAVLSPRPAELAADPGRDRARRAGWCG